MAASTWAPLRLGEVCTKIGSGATPRGGSEVYLSKGPYALIRSQNVHNDGFHHDGLAFIGDMHARELENVEVCRGDVLLNITGDSVARACQVDPSVLPARVNQHVAIIRPDPKKLDPRFLRYFLISPNIQTKLLSWAGSGGTRNALTKGMIESFDVLAPKDVSEQASIACVLGTLDDKIVLNERMNATLEVMARSLFKSWFVDFGPVRAKVEGRDPGLPETLADLFPNRFEDSELGEIPRGWSVQSLREIADVFSGGTPSKSASEYWNGSLPWISPKAMKGIHVHNSEETVTPAAVGHGTRLVQKGTVLVMVRGMGLHQGVRISQAQCSVTFNQDVKALVPKWGDGSFLLFALLNTSPYLFSKVQSAGHGTGVLPTDVLEGLSFALPPESVRNPLLGHLANLNARIDCNLRTSATLGAIRDALIPKLVSGDVKSPGARFSAATTDG